MSTIRKIDLLYREFGRRDDHICKECSNVIDIIVAGTKKLTKCRVYGVMSGGSTDWRLHWAACGMFNKEYKGRPIIELVQREKSPAKEEPLDGQVSLY